MSKEGGVSTSTISQGISSSPRGLSALRSTSIPLAQFKAPTRPAIKILSSSEIRSFSKPQPSKLDQVFGPKLDLTKRYPIAAPKTRILDRNQIQAIPRKSNLSKQEPLKLNPPKIVNRKIDYPNINQFNKKINSNPKLNEIVLQKAASKNISQNFKSLDSAPFSQISKKLNLNRQLNPNLNIKQPITELKAIAKINQPITERKPTITYNQPIFRELKPSTMTIESLKAPPTPQKQAQESLILKPQTITINKPLEITKLLEKASQATTKATPETTLQPDQRQIILNKLINLAVKQETTPALKTNSISLTETKADLNQAKLATQKLIAARIAPESARKLVSKSLKFEFLRTAYQLQQSENQTNHQPDTEDLIVATLVKLKISKYLQRRVLTRSIQRHYPTEQNRYKTWKTLAEQQIDPDNLSPISGESIVKSLPSTRPEALISPILHESRYDGLLEDAHKQIAKTTYHSLTEAENHFQSLIEHHPAAEEVETVSTELISESQIQRIIRGKLSRQELDSLLSEMATELGYPNIRF